MRLDIAMEAIRDYIPLRSISSTVEARRFRRVRKLVSSGLSNLQILLWSALST